MTLSQIARALFTLAAISAIPLLLLSLRVALITGGLALIFLIPLWWGAITVWWLGISLMGAQGDADDDDYSYSGLWWCSLAYHGIALFFWTSSIIRNGMGTSPAVTDYISLVAIFLSPLLGTLLSLLALVKVAWSGRAAQTA